MICVSKRIRYSNQDFDEQMALRRDLAANPRDYLEHADAMVRSHADWAIEHAGRGTPAITPDPTWEDYYIRALYRRLQFLA